MPALYRLIFLVCGCEGPGVEFKGQMNRKLKYFLLSPYRHQTLKRTILSETWVKTFLPNLYRKIKDPNPNISEDLTADGLETTWRQCWSSGRKNVSQTSANPLSHAQGALFFLLKASKLNCLNCVVLWHFVSSASPSSSGWIKTCLYSVISTYGYFFACPDLFTFAEPACKWTNLCA